MQRFVNPVKLVDFSIVSSTFTFYFSILTLHRVSNASLSINKREMKSESGFSLAMASQPLIHGFEN